MDYVLRRNTVKRLMRYYDGSNNIKNKNVVFSGCHLRIIKQYNDLNADEIKSCLKNSVIGNNIDIIKLIYSQRNTYINIINWDTVINLAGCHGKTQIIEWFYNNTDQPRSEDVMDYAASYNNLKTLYWIHEHNYGYCSEKAIDNAASNGHVNTIDWIYKNCTKNYKYALNLAIRNNHTNVVEWFGANTTKKCSHETLYRLVEENRLDMLKCIYKNKIYDDNPWSSRTRWHVVITDTASLFGHQEIIDWIKSIDYLYKN
jgi:hypothetical protein